MSYVLRPISNFLLPTSYFFSSYFQLLKLEVLMLEVMKLEVRNVPPGLL